MLCQRHTQVVLALCLLLVLWQCFRAPLDGLGPFPGTPSLLDTPADHCTASANGSTWFNTRYNMVMGPLLMGAAHELPSDVVQWWLVSGSMAVGGEGRAWVSSRAPQICLQWVRDKVKLDRCHGA